MYPIFSPHHILADKHFWLYIDLGTFLRANNFPQLLHETATVNKQLLSPGGTKLHMLTERWCKGELSNLDYLLKINEFAGISANFVFMIFYLNKNIYRSSAR